MPDGPDQAAEEEWLANAHACVIPSRHDADDRQSAVLSGIHVDAWNAVYETGLVAGVALGFMFAGSLLRTVLPWMTQITPWMFADLAVAVAQGQVYPASVYGPVIGTTIVAGAFMGVALWQFSREEF